MKVIFDLDNTLYKFSWYGRLLMKLSQYFYDLSCKSGRFDRELFDKYKGYEIVILTGRNAKFYKETTKEQLNRDIGTNYRLYICPKNDLAVKWKREVVEQEKPDVWLDDEK